MVYKLFTSHNDFKNLPKIFFELAFFIGFAILIKYFIKIDYFPISNIQSFLYLPIIVAVLGLMLLGFILVPFIFAPLIWAELLKNPLTCRKIIGPSKRYKKVISSYKSNHINIKNEERVKIFHFYSTSVIVGFLTLLIPYLLIPYYISASRFMLLLMPLLLLYLYVRFSIKTATFKQKKLYLNYSTWLHIYIISLLISLLFFSAPVLLIIKLSAINETSEQLAFIGLCILLNSFSLLPPNCKWNLKIWATISSTFSIITILLLFGGLGKISTSIVKTFKFGAMKNITLNVDRDACKIIQQKKSEPKCPASKKVYSISNVDVLWRVGEYFIKVPINDKSENSPKINIKFNTKKKSDNKKRAIILASEHIIDVEPAN